MTDKVKVNLKTKVYMKNNEENNFMELKKVVQMPTIEPLVQFRPVAEDKIGVFLNPRAKTIINEDKGILNHMDRYIINENATVIFWKNGKKTIAKLDAEDKFDKEIGFMLACYKYMALYKNSRLYSKSEMKKELACIKNSKFYDFLFICFNKYTFNDVNKSKKFLEQLKVEKPKVKEEKIEVLEPLVDATAEGQAEETKDEKSVYEKALEEIDNASAEQLRALFIGLFENFEEKKEVE